MSTRISAGVDVSLLFIAMIPIPYYLIVKSQIFPYTYLFNFLVTIIIFDELTSPTSKERMTTNIISVGATTIN